MVEIVFCKDSVSNDKNKIKMNFFIHTFVECRSS